MDNGKNEPSRDNASETKALAANQAKSVIMVSTEWEKKKAQVWVNAFIQYRCEP